MNKQELIKRYKQIVFKTNGGNDDYVVALSQIGEAINELEEPKQDKQIGELEEKLRQSEETGKQRYKDWQDEIGENDRLRNMYAELQVKVKALEMENKRLKEIGKEKAQLAIRELEKTKEWLELKYFDYEQINYLNNIIDNQINDLKMGKDYMPINTKGE